MKPPILIVTQCFYPDHGGIEGLMTGLADALFDEGYPVIVLADRIRDTSSGARSPKPYVVHRFGGPRPFRRWRKARQATQIAQELAQPLAGVFADSWKSVEALPQGLNVPVSVLAHGMEYPLEPAPDKAARIRKALARSHAIIANSRYTADLVRPYLEGDKDRLIVIPPPIDALPEPSVEAIAAVREQIAGRYPVIATVARLEPRKGIDAVIRALPNIVRQHPKCVYAIAGAGDDRARLEELVAAENVGSSAVFLGRVSEETKLALLECADVFAMPVRREGRSVEGFGISYLEAAWFGLPSLAGKEGGAGDAVIDGQTGLLCNGADQDDVTRTLLALLDRDELRVELGTAAQVRVHKELLWSNAISRYVGSFNVKAHT